MSINVDIFSIFTETHLSKQVSVSGNGNGLVSFLIKAKKIGEIDLKFDAVNNFQQDSVEHTLHVDPESHSFAVYEACFIEHASFEQSYNSLYLYIPRKHIDRSINITFNLTRKFFFFKYCFVNEQFYSIFDNYGIFFILRPL